MRKAPAFLLLGVAVPGFSLLPVVSSSAPQPKAVAPHVHAVLLHGVDVKLLNSAAGRTSRDLSPRSRAGLVGAGREGRAPSRPAILTAAEGTTSFQLMGVTWRAGSDAQLT